MKEVKNNRYTARKGLDRLGRYRQYFIAGHSRWFVFIIGLTQFGLIFYNFMWIRLTFLPLVFRSELFFYPVWFMLYFPFTTVFGYWDLTYGTFQAETKVSLEVNPIWKRLFKELEAIKRDLEELKQQLQEKD